MLGSVSNRKQPELMSLLSMPWIKLLYTSRTLCGRTKHNRAGELQVWDHHGNDTA